MIKSNAVLFFLMVSHWLWAQEQGWNIVNPVSEGMNLNSVSFYGENEGFAVGNKGCILHTTDGGDNWEKMDSPTNKNLFGVYCLGIQQTIAVGAGGIILKRTSPSLNWTIVTEGSFHILYDVQFINQDEGFICGQFGTILRSSNGGNSWTELSTNTMASFRGLDFPEPGSILAVGEAGAMLKSSDNGSTWSVLPAPVTQIFFDIHFLSPQLGFMCGSKSSILRTTNGGVRFTKEPLPGGETEEISVFPNYPNPFAEITQLHYNLKKPGRTEQRVFNAQGQCVFQSVRDYEEAGEHILPFRGGHLPSGIYHFHLSFEGKIKTGKMVLIK